jgi:hypothetical protein
MTDLEMLSSRVQKLESRLRWMNRGAIMVGMLIITGAVTAQVRIQQVPGEVLPNRPLADSQKNAIPPAEMEVRSKHFVLVDSKGKERASLVADDAGSAFLVMFDAAGKTRANLSVGNDGPSLVFYDASSHPRSIIGSTTLVGSHVNENGIAELAPPSSIVLFDKAGKLLWRQP